ncbi:hypothetical protein [Dictyobacter formicarum]|uniref:Uncharacterized protein n=1 Tax=Dictyobacter formicarum TaxID=2778368 RepID=A0ABQ3VS96_9CHLR|nr:hypothetical protein [Dictyobacter formicarum]GHO89159.1 hypothetical protein KSZ_71650 [Dictyobacter formicarum]
MAALTFFLATSPSKNKLTEKEIEALILALLREQHIRLPAAIFVGSAQNEVRGEAYDRAAHGGMLIQASQHVIPNAPETMLRLARNVIDGKEKHAETLWYCGDDVSAFLQALHRLPWREKDVCFCFPFLSDALSHDCGWDCGAVLYALTQPYVIDFMDVLDTTAHPLINYPASYFFTLSSFCAGGFSNEEHNPLEPLLQRYWSFNLDLKQT